MKNKLPVHIFPPHLIKEDNTLEELVGLQEKKTSSHGQWGSAPIYKVNVDGIEKSIVIRQDENYAHRGEALKHLNLLEYCCLIQVIEKKGDKRVSFESEHDVEKQETKYKTRVQNKTHAFHSCHPLARTHLQQVRSKMYIAVLAGGTTPEMVIFDEEITNLNDLTKKTRTSLTYAARYYMTLLSP